MSGSIFGGLNIDGLLGNLVGDAACGGSFISVGGIAITADTLAAGMSLLSSVYFYDKWSDDVDRLEQLGTDYMTMGKCFCSKADAIYAMEDDNYENARSFKPNQVRNHWYWQPYNDVFPAVAKVQRQAFGIPADDVGGLAEVRRNVGNIVVMAGTARLADSVRIGRDEDDYHHKQMWDAQLDAIGPSPSGISGAFSDTAKSYIKSAQDNSSSFNSSLYSFARSAQQDGWFNFGV